MRGLRSKTTRKWREATGSRLVEFDYAGVLMQVERGVCFRVARVSLGSQFYDR
jgi:hypothetical protein